MRVLQIWRILRIFVCEVDDTKYCIRIVRLSKICFVRRNLLISRKTSGFKAILTLITVLESHSGPMLASRSNQFPFPHRGALFGHCLVSAKG
jgi:hypothetical protein